MPRRLYFDGVQTAEEVSEWRGREGGQPLQFEVVGYPGVTNQISGAGSTFARARSFTIGAGQVSLEPLETFWERRGQSATARYVIGTSVEALAIRVNGVEYPLREDRGVTLAMFGEWEVGSCPFVFVDADGQGMTNRGQVLTDLAGPAREGATQIYLGRRVGRVEIRELEPETSFINAATLIVHNRNGAVRRYPAQNARLRAQDRSYVVLEQGERTTLHFDRVASDSDAAVYLEVSGYYSPARATNGAASPRDLSRVRY